MASQFKFYSLGVVVENKPRSKDLATNNMVNVLPIETMGGFDGEVTLNPTDTVHKGTDASGQAYEVKATTDVALPCTWMPMGNNRITAPDVRRGMQVKIYRLGDSDQFYWKSLGIDDHVMNLETVIYAFSANPAAGGAAIDLNNCYFFEISTHEKLITFQTSQGNGEPFRYTFQLNSGTGEFILTDDIGTLIEMASSMGQVRLANADGSSVEINRQKVELIGPELVSFSSGGTKLELSPAGIKGLAPDYDFK